MRNPERYPAAMASCQAVVTVVYAIIGGVIYYYCGSYVSSPALGSAGGVIKIISYGFALPGLLGTMTIVTHVSHPAEIKDRALLILIDSRYLRSSFSSIYCAVLST
jgi:hypothetical protein